MNVAIGDLARLVKPTFPENLERICTVIKRIPRTKVFPAGVWWFCEFPSPVKTTAGYLCFASIEDSCLRRITGPSVVTDTETDEELAVPAW